MQINHFTLYLIITISFWFGYLSQIFHTKFADERKFPYKWSCGEEDCVYSVKTNRAETTIDLANNHEQIAHPKG